MFHHRWLSQRHSQLSSQPRDWSVCLPGLVILTTRSRWTQELSPVVNTLMTARGHNLISVRFRSESPHIAATVPLEAALRRAGRRWISERVARAGGGSVGVPAVAPGLARWSSALHDPCGRGFSSNLQESNTAILSEGPLTVAPASGRLSRGRLALGAAGGTPAATAAGTAAPPYIHHTYFQLTASRFGQRPTTEDQQLTTRVDLPLGAAYHEPSAGNSLCWARLFLTIGSKRNWVAAVWELFIARLDSAVR